MTSKEVQPGTVTTELGKFISRVSYADLPADVRDAARGRLLDALACCTAGSDLPASRLAADLAKASPGNCTVIGRGYRSTASEAAFANSTMSHSTSQDDLLAGVIHPASAVVPAAIAVAEQEGSSGADLLTAIVMGYEMIWRFYRGTGKMANSAFRPGTVFTHFGAAAAAAKLMKLDEKQMANALGYAASLTMGTPNEGWWGGTLEPLLEVGVTTRNGIFCAVLARAGATAAPTVFEGKHGFVNCWSSTRASLPEATKNLGQAYAILRTFIKPFATCGANQLPVQVASTLARHGLRASDVVSVKEKVRVGATDYAGLDFKGPFVSHTQALMSMQFCTAAAVLGRPLETPDFISSHFDDLEVAALAARVELVEEEGRSSPAFEIHTVDGRVLSAEGDAVDRSIHSPTLEGMRQKFLRLAGPRLGKAGAERVIQAVATLDKTADIRDMTAHL